MTNRSPPSNTTHHRSRYWRTTRCRADRAKSTYPREAVGARRSPSVIENGKLDHREVSLIDPDSAHVSREGQIAHDLERTVTDQTRPTNDRHDQSSRRNDDDLLTIDEVAAILRTPKATLRYWRHLGIGPHSFKIGRRVFYRACDVHAWLDEQAAREHVG
jgi:predicted DNA-binding transcriptional regulator AlpA